LLAEYYSILILKLYIKFKVLGTVHPKMKIHSVIICRYSSNSIKYEIKSLINDDRIVLGGKLSL